MNKAMKLLLGILIGIGITFTGVTLAQETGQLWYIDFEKNRKPATVTKFRDGLVVCYLSRLHAGYAGSGGISCLVEPR
jgi:hypothetical protein